MNLISLFVGIFYDTGKINIGVVRIMCVRLGIWSEDVGSNHIEIWEATCLECVDDAVRVWFSGSS